MLLLTRDVFSVWNGYEIAGVFTIVTCLDLSSVGEGDWSVEWASGMYPRTRGLRRSSAYALARNTVQVGSGNGQ